MKVLFKKNLETTGSVRSEGSNTLWIPGKTLIKQFVYSGFDEWC